MYKLKIVRINAEYCDYLRNFDYRIPYNKNEKQLRPFIGVLFMINDYEYFAPLSSPKSKHKQMKNSLDFLKIDGGKLGAVNFNNMIPVKQDNYTIINLNSILTIESDIKYQELLKNQLNWLNKYNLQLSNKSCKLYTLYVNDKLNPNIKNRCCNFKLLEKICNDYNRILV